VLAYVSRSYRWLNLRSVRPTRVSRYSVRSTEGSGLLCKREGTSLYGNVRNGGVRLAHTPRSRSCSNCVKAQSVLKSSASAGASASHS